MDPTGLLDAVLAVAVYPGAGFLAVAALLHAYLAGGPAANARPSPVPPASVLPLLAATVATAMLPMVGAPALRLPPTGGVAGNAVVIVVLLAVAVDLGGGSFRVSGLAAAAILPLAALAAAEGTVSALTISTADGNAALAARAVTALLLVVAASVASAGRAAAVVSAALALAAAAVVIPDALRTTPPVVCAVTALGVVAVSGLLSRWRHRWSDRTLAVVGIAGAAAGAALALVSGRA